MLLKINQSTYVPSRLILLIDVDNNFTQTEIPIKKGEQVWRISVKLKKWTGKCLVAEARSTRVAALEAWEVAVTGKIAECIAGRINLMPSRQNLDYLMKNHETVLAPIWDIPEYERQMSMAEGVGVGRDD